MAPKHEPDEKSEDGNSTLEYGDLIDPDTFEQILEMDDDDTDREFSRSLVFGFFDQAGTTFTSIEQALETGDLKELSELGHFLKGSSATLGLVKVREACELIQNYGQHKDESGQDVDWDDKKLLEKTKAAFTTAKKEHTEVEKRLKAYYNA